MEISANFFVAICCFVYSNIVFHILYSTNEFQETGSYSCTADSPWLTPMQGKNLSKYLSWSNLLVPWWLGHVKQ